MVSLRQFEHAGKRRLTRGHIHIDERSQELVMVRVLTVWMHVSLALQCVCVCVSVCGRGGKRGFEKDAKKRVSNSVGSSIQFNA